MKATRSANAATKHRNDGRVSTSAAAELLGISVSQFARIMLKLGHSHDGEYPNPHYKSGPPAKLWSRKKVVALKRRKIVQQAVTPVGRQRYTWFLPDSALDFTPRVEATRDDDGKRYELDPSLNIARSKLAEAKALVRFAIGDAAVTRRREKLQGVERRRRASNSS